MASLWRRNRQLALLHSGHPACVQRLASGTRWNALRQLGRIRVWAECVLDRHIAAPQSALAAALLLGSRERLDRATVQEFFVSGTVHLLSISGSHVAILASVMWIVIRLDWFPRRRMLLVTCVLAVAYALLTGAQPPVVRATILIVVYCLARWTSRHAVAWNSLAAAGLVTLGLSPGGMYDVGTQLSYLAVATLVAQRPLVFAPRSRDPLNRLVEQSRPGWSRLVRTSLRGAWQLIVASTMIWLVSMPLVANRFHLVPLIGVLANLLLWLPIPVALFSGLAVLVVGARAAPGRCLWMDLPTVLRADPVVDDHLGGTGLGTLVVGRAADVVSTAILCAVGGVPVWPHSPAQALVAGLAGCVVDPQHRERIHGCADAACGAGTTTAVLVHRRGARDERARGTARREDDLCTTRAAWGVRSPPCCRSPRSCGRGASPTLTRSSCRMPMPTTSMPCRNCWTGSRSAWSTCRPSCSTTNAAAVAALRTAIVAAGVPVEHLCEGARLVPKIDGEVEVLHPPPAGCRGGDNSNSIVLRIGLGSQGVLLTGDLEEDGLDELLAEPPGPCDVLLAPHHGSRRSRPRDDGQLGGSLVGRGQRGRGPGRPAAVGGLRRVGCPGPLDPP